MEKKLVSKDYRKIPIEKKSTDVSIRINRFSGSEKFISTD
jgi:hypothetical protein